MKNRLPPTGDRGVYLLGFAAVASVGLFATAMLTRDERAPRIAAIEHFGIFARPAALRAARPAAPDPGIDPIVTGGVVAAPRKPAASADGAPALGGFRLVGVLGDQAIVVSDAGFHRVRAGGNLPGAGAVERIEQRESGWALILRDGGVIAAAPR